MALVARYAALHQRGRRRYRLRRPILSYVQDSNEDGRPFVSRIELEPKFTFATNL